jgi:hypothetical protein
MDFYENGKNRPISKQRGEKWQEMNAGKVPSVGRDSFLSNSFTFIECVEALNGSAI